MQDQTAIKLDATDHPRSVALAWWLVTCVTLMLLAYAYTRPEWPYATSRSEVGVLVALVGVLLPGLYLMVFGQQVWISDAALIVRLGRLGWVQKHIPLAAIHFIEAAAADSIAEFSRKETGGRGRGMTCYYTQGRNGVEVATNRKRYFISCSRPDTVVAAVRARQSAR